ncbi:MAG: AAA family ATPase, partial [Planctomycetes bacterium]|nr:AAA family ATPase [Planctomycetota bacterium]
MQLHEQHRPKDWGDIVGQDKVIAKLNVVRRRGLSGRAYWLAGQSGTGKTTIARLIAAEIADDFGIDEIDAQHCTPARIAELERSCRCRTFGKGGRAIIINEAHGLSKPAIRQLLVTLERIPAHVVWCFTTTVDGQESLFDGQIDAHPLLSRCVELPLSRRGLAE